MPLSAGRTRTSQLPVGFAGRVFKHGSAEELAEDEEVKRLYLGRNFELKRKDYLLDGWSNPRAPEVESIIRSLEDLRQQILTKDENEVFSTENFPVDLNDTTILENSWEGIDQTSGDVIAAIRLFIQTGSDNAFKKEVEAILAEDYDRRQQADALLAAFQKYQLTHAE